MFKIKRIEKSQSSMKQIKAYKLFHKRKDGSIGPLFINRPFRIEFNKWLKAEEIPTKGYAFRPGWHSSPIPKAEHLKEGGRVWVEVQIKDFYVFKRPAYQGGEWYISKWIKVIRELTNEELDEIRKEKRFVRKENSLTSLLLL